MADQGEPSLVSSLADAVGWGTGSSNGRFPGMRVTIDRLGRILVPKPVRDRLLLRGGETFELEERDGVLELRPAVMAVKVVETPEGPVLQPLGDVPPLTDAMVRETLERGRR